MDALKGVNELFDHVLIALHLLLRCVGMLLKSHAPFASFQLHQHQHRNQDLGLYSSCAKPCS